ncbi:hypothetical protein GOODEAATRI_014830 [Goodea atripinnis]|uniref:Uncharacterized protein n=1 Tax=Goodea atripinnis TaxID=208336 RepID=A0ABV0PE76_9TELE
MAAHAFLICSLALLSALSQPGLTFTEEEFQPGLIYDEGEKSGGGRGTGDARRDAGMLMCTSSLRQLCAILAFLSYSSPRIHLRLGIQSFKQCWYVLESAKLQGFVCLRPHQTVLINHRWDCCLCTVMLVWQEGA